MNILWNIFIKDAVRFEENPAFTPSYGWRRAVLHRTKLSLITNTSQKPITFISYDIGGLIEKSKKAYIIEMGSFEHNKEINLLNQGFLIY